MQTKVRIFLLVVPALVAMGIGGYFGRLFPFVEQVQLLRELREVSTIIFGIMGAWSAIVYPDQLKRALRPTELLQVDDDALSRFRTLMLCIMLSAGIIAIILTMQFAAPVLSQIGWVRQHAQGFRAISFAMTCFLGVAQFWVILLMLKPINEADADVRRVQSAKESLAQETQAKHLDPPV
jgi:hypothetical protein